MKMGCGSLIKAEPLAGSAQEHALRLFRALDLRRRVGEYPSCALCEVRRTNRAALDGGIFSHERGIIPLWRDQRRRTAALGVGGDPAL